MARYVALLRGINVGGKNVIRMAELRECFAQGGFADVRTYIQSGNVTFNATGSASELTSRIERMLADAFDYDASVVLRSRTQLRAVVNDAPPGFGADPDRYRSDVLFLMPPLTPAQALRGVATRDGVDRAWKGPGVLYFDRLTERAAQSQLSKLVGTPIYRQLTIRNWNTTTTLLSMLEE